MQTQENRTTTRTLAGAAVALLVLALTAGAAAAHVTIQPTESTTGAFARFVVRVPNESEKAATVKVEVQMPAELGEIRYQPKAGWKRTVNGKTVTWEGGRIEPGEFEEFGFSTQMPQAAGTLAFPSIQTYDDGEVVQWTGPADADKPAGRVTVKQAEGGAGGGHGAPSPTTTEGASSSRNDGGDGEDAADSDNDALVYAGAGLGALGFLLGLIALARSGRGRRTES